MTTLAYVVLDPARGVARARQRRPPAAARRSPPEGEAVVPAAAGQRRARHHRARALHERAHPFPAGHAVVLYTDGLVEVRGESIDEGLERLRALARRGTTSTRCARGSSTARPRASAPTTWRSSRRAHPAAAGPAERPAGPPTASRSPRPPAAAPLAARLRRGRGRGVRHHRRLPGGVRQRDRARLRPGPQHVRRRGRLRAPARPRGGARPWPLAPAARHEPRPRAAADERADGFRRHPHTDRGTEVVLERTLARAAA